MRLSVFLFTGLVLLAAATPQPEEPRKLALIIAIGTYDPATGWNPISSLNDITYVKSALIGQGFEENNIEVIKNEQATKEGIIAAIDRLNARAKPGDIVVFHFSGHGQQIFDDANKDEADGYDEALVPYNANSKFSSAYTGQNHLRDDDLGNKFKTLRKNIGKEGSLLVILDACYSGTATRGQDIGIVRGTDEKLEPPGYAKTIPSSRGNEPDGLFDDKELLANMVVISAASADERNVETKDAEKNGVGSLSYAFSKAISQTSGTLNYKILFEKIKTAMQSWNLVQHPQIEGNTDQQVLGGKYVRTPDIIRIARWNPDNTVEIDRGAIHSVIKGAKFSLYSVDVSDFKNATPIASGEIVDGGMIKSTGHLTTAIPDKSKAYNVVFESKSYGDMSVTVKISLPETAMAGLISQKLKQYDYIKLENSNADIAITPYKDPATKEQLLQVVAKNDSILWQKPWPGTAGNQLSENETEEIWKSVKQYSRAQFLRSIYTPAEAKVFEYVRVDFIPGTIKTINGNDSLVKKKKLQDITNAKGDLQFLEADTNLPENEGFIIQVRNLHDYPVFLSVIDIMPDNSIGVVIPDPEDFNSTADDYKIAPGKQISTRPIKLFPPYGKDFMKILITRTAMDLKAMQSRSTSRGAGSSFETFYNDTFKDDNSERSRGPQVAPVKVDEVKIIPFTYMIVKRK